MKAKAMKDVLEQEYQMLKLTLEVLANDNVKLKNDLAELSNNVKKNKLQLQDYLNTITDKDTAVSNLNKKIEMLHIRLSEINKIKGHNTNGNGLTEENTKITKKPQNNYKYKINRDSFVNFCKLQLQLNNEINKLKLQLNNYTQTERDNNKKNIICENKVVHLNDVLDKESVNNILKIFEKNKEKNNKMYIVDKNKKIWKFTKRGDLSINDILQKSHEINKTPILEHTTLPERILDKQNNKKIEITNEILEQYQYKDLYTKVVKYSKVSDMLKDSFIL